MSSRLSRRSARIILALLHIKETSFVCRGKRGFLVVLSAFRAVTLMVNRKGQKNCSILKKKLRKQHYTIVVALN